MVMLEESGVEGSLFFSLSIKASKWLHQWVDEVEFMVRVCLLKRYEL